MSHVFRVCFVYVCILWIAKNNDFIWRTELNIARVNFWPDTSSTFPSFLKTKSKDNLSNKLCYSLLEHPGLCIFLSGMSTLIWRKHNLPEDKITGPRSCTGAGVTQVTWTQLPLVSHLSLVLTSARPWKLAWEYRWHTFCASWLPLRPFWAISTLQPRTLFQASRAMQPLLFSVSFAPVQGGPPCTLVSFPFVL